MEKQGMESHFCSYEQALGLKELGFDEDCFAFHSTIYGLVIGGASGNSVLYESAGECLAALKQQAFIFFRDNHQLFYTIETNCSQLSFEWGFDYTIYDKENDKWLSTEPQNCPAGETTYKTYEEAESACINKLIEIVKKK